jgi:hypothetical protein
MLSQLSFKVKKNLRIKKERPPFAPHVAANTGSHLVHCLAADSQSPDHLNTRFLGCLPGNFSLRASSKTELPKLDFSQYSYALKPFFTVSLYPPSLQRVSPSVNEMRGVPN